MIIANTIALLIPIRNLMMFKRPGGRLDPAGWNYWTGWRAGRLPCARQWWKFSAAGELLFFDRAEREDCFAVKLVEDLRQSGVDRREAADQSFVTREMFEADIGTSEVAISKQEE